MRLLAFTDLHENTKAFERVRRAAAKENVDVIVCVGDFTVFGRSTDEWLARINELPVPVVMVHGNHEDEDEVAQGVVEYRNIHFVHTTSAHIGGVTFVGFGGHGFSRREPELEAFAKKNAALFHDRTIILCHAPPYETALDEVEDGWHVGNESLRQIIRKHNPLLVLSGHIHECFHRHDRIGRTTLINPGPDGEIIDIELSDTSHQ